MAKQSIYRKSRTNISFNLTPMIDITFQLIIFFMLVTQMVSADYADIELPRPHGDTAESSKESNQVIVNIVPYSKGEIGQDKGLEGLCKEYTVGITEISRGDEAKLKRILVKAHSDSPKPEQFIVVLRAGRDIYYEQITPVLGILREAKLGKMHITVLKLGQESEQ